MRYALIVLALLLFMAVTAQAEPVAIGFNRWQDGDTKTSTLGSFPMTYQEDGEDSWISIVPDWVWVNDTTAKVVKGVHKLFAFKNGNLYYVQPRNGVRHALGIRPVKLIQFNKLDSSYVVLADVEYDSVSVSGPVLTYHNIFPGIDRKCIYEHTVYSDRFVFSQEARDSLATAGPWANRLLGIASRLNVDSLNLQLRDRGGVFSPTVQGRITSAWVAATKQDTIVMCLRQSWLHTADSLTSVPVHKRVVILSGQPYLVELFNPIPTASWPDGPIWHNAEIGYDSNFATGLDVADNIGGMSFEAISSSGTLDSMRAYLSVGANSWNIKMGIYSDDGAGGYARVDSVDEWIQSKDESYNWYSKVFVQNATVNAGTRYVLVAWGEDIALSNLFLAYYTERSAQPADSIFYDAGQTFGAWPATLTQDIGDSWERPVSIIAFYTETSTSARRKRAAKLLGR